MAKKIDPIQVAVDNAMKYGPSGLPGLNPGAGSIDQSSLRDMDDIHFKEEQEKRQKAADNSLAYSPEELSGAMRTQMGDLQRAERPMYDIGQSHWDKDIYDEGEWRNASDIRALNQGSLYKIGNGILKAGVLAGTTFFDGTVGLLSGIGTGIFSDKTMSESLWNNAVSQFAQDINQKAEKYLPNYYTRSEQTDPWYEHVFSANFLGDKFLKNLGFTVGAFYSGNVVSSTLGRSLGAIAKGVSKAAKVVNPNLAVKASRAIASNGLLRNTMTTKAITSGVGAFISALNEGRIEALNNSTEWFKVQKGNIDREYNQQVAAAKANGASQDELQKLEQHYNDTIAQLSLKRADMGNADMYMNLPILTFSNLVQFSRLYANGFKTARHTNNIRKVKTPKGMIGAKLDDKIYELKNNPTLKGKLWAIAKDPIMEGTEEISQKAAQVIAGKAYEEDVLKFWNNKEDYVAKRDLLNDLSFLSGHMMSGIRETLGDSSSWEEFTIGALTGALGMPMFRNGKFSLQGGIKDSVKEYNEQFERDQKIADEMNRIAKSPEFKNYLHNLTRAQAYENAKSRAAQDGDNFAFKNAYHGELMSSIQMFQLAGRLQDLKDLVNESFDLSDENLETIVEETTKDLTLGTDENTGEPVTVKSGPFVDSKGNVDYEEMKKQLTDTKNTIIGKIDEYVKEHEYLDTLVGESLSDEGLQELTWLKCQLNDWTQRGKEMSKEVKEYLNPLASNITEELASIRQEISEKMEAYQKSTDKKPEDYKKIKELQAKAKKIAKTVEKMQKVMNSKPELEGEELSLAFLLTDPEVFNTIVSTIYADSKNDEHDNNRGRMQLKDKEWFLDRIQDLSRLAKSYYEYNTKMAWYTTHPLELMKDMEDSEALAKEKAINEALAEQKQAFYGMQTLDEFKRAMGALDPETASSMYMSLKSDRNTPEKLKEIISSWEDVTGLLEKLIPKVYGSDAHEAEVSKQILTFLNSVNSINELLEIINDPNNPLPQSMKDDMLDMINSLRAARKASEKVTKKEGGALSKFRKGKYEGEKKPDPEDMDDEDSNDKNPDDTEGEETNPEEIIPEEEPIEVEEPKESGITLTTAGNKEAIEVTDINNIKEDLSELPKKTRDGIKEGAVKIIVADDLTEDSQEKESIKELIAGNNGLLDQIEEEKKQDFISVVDERDSDEYKEDEDSGERNSSATNQAGESTSNEKAEGAMQSYGAYPQWQITPLQQQRKLAFNDAIKYPEIASQNKVLLENTGAYAFVNSGALWRVYNEFMEGKNEPLKIHYVMDKNNTNVILLAVSVEDIESAGEKAISPREFGGRQFQIVGRLGYYGTQDTNSKNNFTELLEALHQEMKEAGEDKNFVSEKYFNHIKAFYSGRFAKSKELPDDGQGGPTIQLSRDLTDETQLDEFLQGKQIHFGISISDENFATPTLNLETDRVITPNTRHAQTANSRAGSVWLMSQEADGNWYPKAVRVARFNNEEYPESKFGENEIYKTIRQQLEILVNPNKSLAERAIAKYALEEILYFPQNCKLLFNHQVNGYDSVSLSDGTNNITGNIEEISAKVDKMIEVLLSKNLRFQVTRKGVEDREARKQLFLNGIVSCDLVQLGNENASFDVYLNDMETGNPLDGTNEYADTSVKEATPKSDKVAEAKQVNSSNAADLSNFNRRYVHKDTYYAIDDEGNVYPIKSNNKEVDLDARLTDQNLIDEILFGYNVITGKINPTAGDIYTTEIDGKTVGRTKESPNLIEGVELQNRLNKFKKKKDDKDKIDATTETVSVIKISEEELEENTQEEEEDTDEIKIDSIEEENPENSNTEEQTEEVIEVAPTNIPNNIPVSTTLTPVQEQKIDDAITPASTNGSSKPRGITEGEKAMSVEELEKLPKNTIKLLSNWTKYRNKVQQLCDKLGIKKKDLHQYCIDHNLSTSFENPQDFETFLDDQLECH